MRLSEAHVVVTGATRGLGRHIAEEMSARGARLTLVARDDEALAQTAARLGAQPVRADLSDPAATAAVIPEAARGQGPVEVLVNNAALNPVGPLGHCDSEDLRAVLMTNLHAPLELARAALGDMLERRQGAIVNVSSLAGVMAMRNAMPYGTSKAGLTLATRTLRRTGVRAHLVVLGIVDTEMVPRAAAQDALTRAATDRFAGALKPLDPRAVARRIADAVETDRRRDLILPAAAVVVLGLTNIPSRAADLLWAGMPNSYDAP